MQIVYRLKDNGEADNFRYEKDNYNLKAKEIVLNADTIPTDITAFYSLAYRKQLATKAIRQNRNQLLMDTDFIMLSDIDKTADKIVLWKAYRRALRDYMATVADPFNPPALPVHPEVIS